MTPTDIRRAALWLHAQARRVGLREADARLDRRSRWARAQRQARDARGRWTESAASDAECDRTAPARASRALASYPTQSGRHSSKNGAATTSMLGAYQSDNAGEMP